MMKDSVKDLLEQQGVIACSQSTRTIYENALSIAQSDATVLILGESGTGKDYLARFIHNNSKRKNQPFIHVNCSAIPEDLFEAELFGFASGAFTGSYKEQKGLAEQANNGTLFLDEVGELSFAMQTKLLHLVQDRKLQKIGTHQTQTLNIRLIAATNQDLKKKMEQGTFRLDLFYRLNVVSFALPPLRRRKEDLIGLIKLLCLKNEQCYKIKKELSQQAMEYLLEQEWLGNIREVQNFVQRVYILEEESVITKENLEQNYHFSKTDLEPIASKPEFLPLQQAMKRFEKRYIKRAIKRTQTMAEAAELLGISVAALRNKMD